MKTFSALSAFAALTLASLTAVALAGPGPQSWMKAPAPQPAAPVALGTCSGCSTTIQWKISDRGPAGKGVAAAAVARRTHSCTACSGTTVADTNGQTHSTMVTAAACGQMLCCK